MLDKNNSMGSKFGSTETCTTIVGVGSRMKGEVTCKGVSRIAGEIEGNLDGDDRIIIDKDALVTGQVTAGEVEIDGKVVGTVTASHRIILNDSAIVEGDLESPSVIIEEGARFNGKSNMPLTNEATDADNVHVIDVKSSDSEASAG